MGSDLDSCGVKGSRFNVHSSGLFKSNSIEDGACTLGGELAHS